MNHEETLRSQRGARARGRGCTGRHGMSPELATSAPRPLIASYRYLAPESDSGPACRLESEELIQRSSLQSLPLNSDLFIFNDRTRLGYLSSYSCGSHHSAERPGPAGILPVNDKLRAMSMKLLQPCMYYYRTADSQKTARAASE